MTLALVLTFAGVHALVYRNPGLQAAKGGAATTIANRSSSEAAAIDQAAVDLAASMGNSAPSSVTWIATTEDAALNLLNRGPDSDTPISGGQPVYVLIITGGTFYMYSASQYEGNGKVPQGTHADAILSQSDFSWQGGGVGFNSSYDLSSLGTPETDSLAGIQPESGKQFKARFLQKKDVH
jgi:hypothetical protein